jgi:hypothetical protein
MAAYMIGLLTEAWVGKFGSVPRPARGAIEQGLAPSVLHSADWLQIGVDITPGWRNWQTQGT